MMENKRTEPWEWGLSFLAFEGLCWTFWVWYSAARSYSPNTPLWEQVRAKVLSPSGPMVFLLSISALIFFVAIRLIDFQKAAKLLFQYRYPLAAAVFVLCVAMGLSGSSFGTWNYFLGRPDTDLVLGIDRPIRTDEWAVWTPMVASQYLDPAGHFSYFSSVLRAAPTDVFLEYGTPVLSWVTLFRPFHLGFLFLPLANGMAFFWAGRQITLLLVCFEFGRLLTKDERVLSAVYALLVAFSPVVEWWFAINGFVEMLIYLQLSILALKKYLCADDLRTKLLCTVTAVVCAGGYALTMYPAWMIPLAYVLLALAVWVIMDEWKNIRLGRTDALLALGAVLVLGALFAWVYHCSAETIRLMMGTVYPGSRIETGGAQLRPVFGILTNLWTGLLGGLISPYECEVAGVLSMFPLSLFLVIVLLVNGRRDKLCFALLAAELFLGFYCFCGFPTLMARLTLLSSSPANRCIIVFEICDMMLLIRALSLVKEGQLCRRAILVLAVVLAFVACFAIETRFPAAIPSKLLILTGMAGALLCFLLLEYTQRHQPGVLLFVVLGIAFLSGMIVNPVRKGMDAVQTLPEREMIRSVAEQDPEAVWAVAIDFPFMNLPVQEGARTINSTNVYPLMERWRQFDPEGTYAEAYNRYAHIVVELTEKVQPEERFTILQTDVIKVQLSPEDLRTLGVTYILTFNDLDDKNYQMIASEGSMRVYRFQ